MRSVRSVPADLLTLADADLDALADRLHDGPLQALVAARYACDASVRGAADPALARAAVQDALVALRREMWLLRPRGAGGLPDALAALSAQQSSAGLPGLALHLDTGVAAALSPEASAAAYRLVQAVSRTAGGVLIVRLTGSGDVADLELDAPVDAPDGWALRARALGGDLVTDAARTRLRLPIGTHDDDAKDRP